jgi:hypothetical protein
VSFGQNLQPLQLRQMIRIVFITGMFEPVVLFDLRRIGQINRVVQLAQPIHQPIPVERRFDGQRRQVPSVRLQKVFYLFQAAFQLSVRHSFALLVD